MPEQTPPTSDKAAVKEALSVMFPGSEPVVEDPKPPAAEAPKEETPKEEPKPTEQKPVEAKVEVKPKTEMPSAPEPVMAAPAGLLDDVEVPDGLSKSDIKTLESLAMLEKMNPERAGIANKTVQFWKAEESYIEDWQKKNLGIKFNREDPEHSAWYDKNEPVVPEEELKEAEDQAKEYRVTAKARAELAMVDAERQEIQRHKQELPVIEQAAAAGVAELISAIAPDLVKAVAPEGLVLNDETWAKMEEEDPAAAEVLKREGGYLERKLIELERLNKFQRTYRPDPSNRLHHDIANAILSAEDKISAKPAAEQLFKGKQFISQSDFRRKQMEVFAKFKGKARDAEMQKVEDAHWMLTPAMIKKVLVAEHRARAEKKLGVFRKVEERLKKKIGGSSPNSQPKADQRQPEPPAPARSKHDFGPSTPGADTMPSRIKGGGGPTSTAEHLEMLDR